MEKNTKKTSRSLWSSLLASWPTFAISKLSQQFRLCALIHLKSMPRSLPPLNVFHPIPYQCHPPTAHFKRAVQKEAKVRRVRNLCQFQICRSQLPRGLRRRSTTVHLMGSWVRIPPGAWTFVCCECCVLLGRGLCDELAPRPGKSYRLWCVVVCKFETS